MKRQTHWFDDETLENVANKAKEEDRSYGYIIRKILQDFFKK